MSREYSIQMKLSTPRRQNLCEIFSQRPIEFVATYILNRLLFTWNDRIEIQSIRDVTRNLDINMNWIRPSFSQESIQVSKIPAMHDHNIFMTKMTFSSLTLASICILNLNAPYEENIVVHSIYIYLSMFSIMVLRLYRYSHKVRNDIYIYISVD